MASTLPVCSERGVAYSTFTIVKVKNDGWVYIAEFDNPLCVYFKDNKEMCIRDRVFEAHASEIFEEAENRLHAQKAVMVKLMGQKNENKYKL